MNPIVALIANGQCFFLGIALLILAPMVALQTRGWVQRIAPLAFLLGIIAVVVSSAAIPLGCYVFAGLMAGGWIVACCCKQRQREWSYACVGGWFLAAGFEIPFHIMPTVAPVTQRALTIVGDSVTAGIGGDEKSETWPKILAREHQIEVQDLSQMGETAASALKNARKAEIVAPIVFLEIGGNDLLGTTSAQKFKNDLDQLCTHLQRPGRQLVMFELPLPPLNHEYGHAQRSIAAKHSVKLIPKRVFLAVLADGAATLDSVHLSQAGHRRMSNCVWQILEPAYATAEKTE